MTAVLHTCILGVQGPRLAQGPQVSLRVVANGYMSVSNSLQGDWSLEGIKEIQLLLRLVRAFLPWKFLELQQWHLTYSFLLLPLSAWFQPLPPLFYLLIMFMVYSAPFAECCFCERRVSVCFINCCILSPWNSAWHTAGTQAVSVE